MSRDEPSTPWQIAKQNFEQGDARCARSIQVQFAGGLTSGGTEAAADAALVATPLS